MIGGGNLISFEMISGVFTGSVAAGDLLTPLWRLFIALAASIIGVVALAAGVTGYFKTNIGWQVRTLLCVSAAMLFFAPNVAGRPIALAVNIAGGGAIRFDRRHKLEAGGKDNAGAGCQPVPLLRRVGGDSCRRPSRLAVSTPKA